MEITGNLKQELDFAIHSYELITLIVQKTDNYETIQKLQPYNTELQRAANHLNMNNILLTTIAATATAATVGTLTHNVLKRK